MFVIVVLLGIITLFYGWMKWNYSYWKRNKVLGPEPKLLVGNMGSVLNMTEHFGLVGANWYNEYPNEPYIGYYKMLQPAILVRDPNLIKDVLATNFNSFRNNDAVISKRFDPLSATNPFFKEDDEWRESRKTITPMFSQSRLKTVMPVMNSVGSDFAKFIKSFPVQTDHNAKEISTRFTTENVIKCEFSIEPDCFNIEKPNEFLNVPNLLAPSMLTAVKTISIFYLPQWMVEWIPIPFIPYSMDQWFRNLVKTNKTSRSKNSQSNDLFQTLLQIQEKNNYDDSFLAGHSMSLYLDGTETSAVALSYAMYELARNPDCQEKLYEEVTKILTKYGGNPTYEALQEMNYLEGVILEASRIHPPALALTKLCTESYTLPKTSKQSEPTTIKPGTVVQIPIFAIHMDPKHFSDPDEFKPERFSDEEQRNRHKYTFLTFGEGNRACLGMRFAMLQTKIALIHVILKLNIKLSPSQKPIVLDPQTLLSYPKDGIILRFETR